MRIFAAAGLLLVAISVVIWHFIPAFGLAKVASDAIRIQIGGEPGTLDPVIGVDQYAFSITRNLDEGLFRLDGDGKLQNALAASYKISADGLEYRFKIRANAKWSDAKPVTVDDFIFGWSHAVDHRTASENAEYLFAIKNAKEVFAGKKRISDLGLSKSRDDELVVRLEHPEPAFLNELSLPVASPWRRDVFDAAGGKWSPQFPTTGPYTISVYNPSEKIELQPNKYAERPGRRPILFRILPEEVTALNLFEAGYLDVISTVTPTEVDRLRGEGLIRAFPSNTVFFFGFNVSKPPFNDIRWRKAVAGAVDRIGTAKLAKKMFEPIEAYLAPSVEGNIAFPGLSFASAVQELRAKIGATQIKPRVTAIYGSAGFGRLVMEKTQEDLKTKLGLEMNLEPLELKMLIARLQSDPPEMYFLSKSALFNDPTNQLNAFANVSNANFSRYKNDEYEGLVSEIATTVNQERRTEEMHRAQEIIVKNDVVLVPMLLRLQEFGVAKAVKGFQVNPFQTIQLNQLDK